MSNSLASSVVREVADSEARDSEEARGTTAEAEAATGRVDNNMLRSKLTSQHEFLLDDDFHDTGPAERFEPPNFSPNCNRLTFSFLVQVRTSA